MDIYSGEQCVLQTIEYAYGLRFFDASSSLKSFKTFCDEKWANETLDVDQKNSLNVFEKVMGLYFTHSFSLTNDQKENAFNYMSKYSAGIPDQKFTYEGTSFNPLGIAIKMWGVDRLHFAIELMKSGHDIKNAFHQNEDYIKMLNRLKIFLMASNTSVTIKDEFVKNFNAECLLQNIDFINCKDFGV